MMRSTFLVLLVFISSGCFDHKEKTLGSSIDGTSISIVAAERFTSNLPVVLNGTMIKKCPVAGCWFMLRDQTGIIKVDTKNAGFVVVDVPLNAQITIAGRIASNGTERLIEATGVRY